jgi:hypothetical protein
MTPWRDYCDHDELRIRIVFRYSLDWTFFESYVGPVGAPLEVLQFPVQGAAVGGLGVRIRSIAYIGGKLIRDANGSLRRTPAGDVSAPAARNVSQSFKFAECKQRFGSWHGWNATGRRVVFVRLLEQDAKPGTGTPDGPSAPTLFSGGCFHVPFSASSLGQYSRSTIQNSPFGAGNQLDSRTIPGDSC